MTAVISTASPCPLSAGYAAGKNKYAGNVEWRQDQNTSSGDRITWLMRNSVGYQISPDWRLIGKLNGSISYTDAGDEYGRRIY